MTQASPPIPGPSAGPLVRNRSATVANPPKSAPPGGALEKEKRKRSRVTPEQLAHLERIFAIDRSPTAAKRKEISEMLGMQERQTQIWFQNRYVCPLPTSLYALPTSHRRAKAKTLEGKGKVGFRGSPTSGGDSPPDTPPDFGAAPDVDLQALIHEDERALSSVSRRPYLTLSPAVTFIPCSDLSIGSWRRISASLGQHDLVAYISNVKRCLTWFIYSNGYGFKMEIPFDTITSTNFTGASPGQGLASFFLSRPPLFYLECMASPTSGLGTTKIWKKCADWTEGQQATKILRHDLVGAAIPLVNALKSLPPSEHPTSLPSAGSMPPGAYKPPDAMPTMHIPQPPMAGLEPPPSFPLAAGGPHAHLVHGRKRSFSGPPALIQSSHDLPDFTLLGAPQPGTSEVQSSYPSGFPEQRASSMSFSSEYSASIFRGFPSMQSSAASHHPHSSLGDFSTVPISHAAAPRPYSASSVDTRFPFNSQATSSVMHGSVDQYSSADAPPTQFESSLTSSPTLLTSAFDPSTLHGDVQMTSAGSGSLEMEASQFGDPSNDSGQQSASHDPPFEATLSIASQHDPPQPPP